MHLTNVVNTTGGLVRYPPISKPLVKVLYIDENTDDVFLINRLLKKDNRADYALETAKNVKQCHEILSKETFDLVLLEPWLQNSNATDTLAQIISLDVRVPIIVLTNVVDEELGQQLIKMGAEDYLPKNQAKILLSRAMTYALERHQLLQQLREKATQDPLTHLLNRAAFFERLEFLVHQGNRNKDSFVAAMLDLDGFKPINDKWGHQAGDIVLSTIGDRLKKSLRRSDIIGRYGGDEFTLILTNYCSKCDIIELLENERSLLTQPINTTIGNKDVCLEVGVSIGATEWIIGETPEDLLNRADEAMYESKQKGKNTLTFH